MVQFSPLKFLARRRPPVAEQKASATGAVIALQTHGRPAWTPRDYAALTREGFARNAVVYRCVRMIAEAAASVPLLLYDGAAEADDHPLLALLARPNRRQAGNDFREALYGYLLVAGNAYVEAVSVDGTPRELHALRPDRVKVVPGPDGWPEAYEYSVADTKQTALGFTAENVANKDIDGTLAANSDTKYASQKAVKTYADTKLPSSYLDTDGTLAANSDAKVPSQKAVKTYVDGLALTLGKRARVRAATTANITIATALNNGDVLDGVTLATGDLVLVKNQSSAQDNGIYVVGITPARDLQFDTYNEHPGSLTAVEEGTANADTLWLCTSNDGGTLNTTALAFSKMVIAGELLAANNLSDVADAATAFGNIKQTATAATTGVVQLGSQVRERLAANRTYYVRTDGSDAHDGLANTSGGAFLTIQKAIDTVAALDISIYDVTIQVGNGTYTGACVLKTLLGSGQVTILGDATTPANVIVSTTANNCFTVQNVVGRWKLKGMKLTAATSGYLLSVSGTVTTIEFENLNFGTSPAISIYVEAGAVLKASGAFTISGGTSYFIYNANGRFEASSITVTLTGTPAFGSVFCQTESLGFTQFYSVTFSGSGEPAHRRPRRRASAPPAQAYGRGNRPGRRR